jgi:hypothetical protein
MDDVRRPRRRRYPVASSAVLAVLLFIGTAAAGNALDWWSIPALAIVVVSLLGTAAGAIAGAIVNRSWLTLSVLPMLAIATTGLLVTQPNLDGGIGDRTVRPHAVATAERAQHLGIGELTVDLMQVPLGTETLDVRAEVGYGRLHVIVPRGVTLIVDGEVRAGDVVVDGVSIADGFHETAGQRFEADGTPAGTVHLDLEIGAGRIDVDRAL